MSGIMKVFLLLALMVCLSHAQFNQSKSNCLCSSVRGLSPQMRTSVKNMQIYPKSIFCVNVEIVVTLKNGQRFCLNPNSESVKKILENMMKPKASTDKPRVMSSTPDSSSSSTAGL